MTKVKIRIAVTVHKDGGWHACGWSDESDSNNQACDEDMMDANIESRGSACEITRNFFIEKEIELPEAGFETIQAD